MEYCQSHWHNYSFHISGSKFIVNEELRCYTFTNFMLSSIQQGIQSGHASMELVNKYMINDDPWGVDGAMDMVANWIANHKTIVCLNGGNAAGIREWKGFFDSGVQSGQNVYPYAGFFEDEQSLDGALTSVAVILPARIYETAALLRRARYDDKINVVWDYVRHELRVAWTDEKGTIRSKVFTQWERDLMEKLNTCQLAT